MSASIDKRLSSQGSFVCGDCHVGYHGNQTVGCRAGPETCADGSTVCDVNAKCVERRGYEGFLCEVEYLGKTGASGRDWVLSGGGRGCEFQSIH